ncbi:MAG: diacylglycerol/lipid kinase family protein [Asticcacaulis sp.]
MRVTEAQHIACLINPNSGTVASLGPATVLEEIRRQLPKAQLSVHGDQGSFDEAIKGALAIQPDMLLTAGGDGTIRSVAQFTAERQIPLIPLPGGTMNVTPQRVFGKRTLMEALAGLSEAQVRPLSAGRVGDQIFLAAAAIGPWVRLADIRESIRCASRWGKLRSSASFLWRKAFQKSVRFRPEETPFTRWQKAEALALAFGSVEQVIGLSPETASLTCPIQGRNPLRAVSLKFQDWGCVVDFAANTLIGQWQEARSVETFRVDTLKVVGGRYRITAMLDGEVLQLGKALTVREDDKGVPCVMLA